MNNTCYQFANKLIAFIKKGEPLFLHTKKFVFQYTKTDWQWMIIILVLAALLRLPYIDHPNHIQFDEVIYANYLTSMLDAQPLFDIHPPLAKIILTEVTRRFEPFNDRRFPIPTTQIFGDFPFIQLRVTIALFGTLLPLLLYGLARVTGARPRVAGLVAIFVVFDSAFIVYSRAILPDMLILNFELLALISAFAAIRKTNTPHRRMYVLLSSIVIGCAVSMKWIALGVLGMIVFLYLITKHYRAAFFSVSIALAVYVGIFFVSLQYYPHGGKIENMIPGYSVSWITDTQYPSLSSFEQTSRFFLTWHHIALRANRDTTINTQIFQAPPPLSWAVAKSEILFWMDTKGHKIILQGNSPLWVTSFFLFLFEITWITVHFFEKNKWPIDQVETTLLMGYIMNYIPYFFISRPMYLYHYFMALLLLILLLPKITPRAIDCIRIVTKDELLPKVIAFTIVILIFLNFIITTSSTYGF